tara:strand:+ start:702 stop:959 length:258 start_codon:yes stop_codon:yes gene_type:complete
MGLNNMGDMNDQQDSEHFTYERNWGEIELMLDDAEKKRNHHQTLAHAAINRDDKIYHMRNYKALEGVVKALRWVLGDLKVKDPLE